MTNEVKSMNTVENAEKYTAAIKSMAPESQHQIHCTPDEPCPDCIGNEELSK